MALSAPGSIGEMTREAGGGEMNLILLRSPRREMVVKINERITDR